MADEYYSIGPSLSGIYFYTGGILGASSSSIQTDATASASKIALASSAIQIETSNQINAIKITSAQSEASISSTLSIAGLEILIILSSVQITSSVNAQAAKTTFASSSISISSSATPLAQRFSTIASIVSILSTSSQAGTKIALSESSSSIVASSEVRIALLGFISKSLSFGLQTSIKPPIRFSPNYIDQTSIRTLFILDNKPLTNHNRKIDISLSPVNTQVVNWNNRANRYYRRVSNSGRKTFTFSWTMLPNNLQDTVDHRNARDFLHSVSEDPDIHELKIVNQNESGLTPYTETTFQVFIRSYSESLIRRYISEGVYLYDCNLVLEEV
jgi:hypothetical protein